MSGRMVAWGAGAGVVLSSISGALINELHGGWPWWIAAGIASLIGALLAGRVAAAATEESGVHPLVVEAGGVYANRDIAGEIRTAPPPSSEAPRRHGVMRWIGPGAVAAGGDITGTARIDTSGKSERTPPEDEQAKRQ